MEKPPQPLPPSPQPPCSQGAKALRTHTSGTQFPSMNRTTDQPWSWAEDILTTRGTPWNSATRSSLKSSNSRILGCHCRQKERRQCGDTKQVLVGGRTLCADKGLCPGSKPWRLTATRARQVWTGV